VGLQEAGEVRTRCAWITAALFTIVLAWRFFWPTQLGWDATELRAATPVEFEHYAVAIGAQPWAASPAVRAEVRARAGGDDSSRGAAIWALRRLPSGADEIATLLAVFRDHAASAIDRGAAVLGLALAGDSTVRRELEKLRPRLDPLLGVFVDAALGRD
jgi:hypothetical protein